MVDVVVTLSSVDDHILQRIRSWKNVRKTFSDWILLSTRYLRYWLLSLFYFLSDLDLQFILDWICNESLCHFEFKLLCAILVIFGKNRALYRNQKRVIKLNDYFGIISNVIKPSDLVTWTQKESETKVKYDLETNKQIGENTFKKYKPPEIQRTEADLQ